MTLSDQNKLGVTLSFLSMNNRTKSDRNQQYNFTLVLQSYCKNHVDILNNVPVNVYNRSCFFMISTNNNGSIYLILTTRCFLYGRVNAIFIIE